jgi:hypothetical protein
MAETPPPLNPNAIIPYVGMYSIPVRLMPQAKARGCNTLMHSETDDGKVSQADWRAAARANGFYYLDFPSADLDADAADPFLIGWLIKDSDEWNRKRSRSNPTTGVWEDYLPDVTPFLAEADRLQAYRAATGKGPSVCANADGPAVTTALDQKPPYPGLKNNERVLMKRLNGLFMDHYPVTNTGANTPAEIARRPMYLPAQAMQRMYDWMGLEPDRVRPQWYGAIIEANTGSGKPLAVTPAQMREQVDYLIGRKAFPYPVDPNANGKLVSDRLLAVEARPRVLIHWTANGANGPAWKWIAQTDEQAAAQTDITKALLGTPTPAPLPDDPAPDAKDALIAELQRQVADAEKRAETAADQYAVCAARVAELQDAIRGLLSVREAVKEAEAKLVTAAK